MFLVRLLPIVLTIGVVAACAKLVAPKAEGQPLSSLAGSEWGYEGQDGPFVKFGANGEMNGNGGCNNFGGSYELNGERLIIGPIMSTKKACMGDVMKQETEFFRALQQAHHVKATHLRLSIFDAENNEILSLVRRDWD